MCVLSSHYLGQNVLYLTPTCLIMFSHSRQEKTLLSHLLLLLDPFQELVWVFCHFFLVQGGDWSHKVVCGEGLGHEAHANVITLC